MKGQKVLFNEFVELEKQQEEKPEGYRQRNFFMPERDRCLCYRYYYYYHIHRLRYDDILKELEREFFLTERRIVEVMQSDRLTLNEIMAEKPTVPELKKLYPWYVWQNRKV